jgi:hypothetical protein
MRKSHLLWLACAPMVRMLMRLFGPEPRDGGAPAGIFDEHLEIREGRVKGVATSQSQRMPRIPSDSEVHAAGLGQDASGGWPVVWSHRRGTFLLAGSHVHLDSRDHACREAMFGIHAATDPLWRRFRRKPLRILEGNWTSIVSRWNDGTSYFHWFMDGLTRLVHLEQFPSDTRILVPSTLPDYAWESLKRLGLADRVSCAEDEDLWIENYWFAGPTMLSGCPDPLGVDWLRSRFRPGDSAIDPDLRIWIDRSANRRSCVNASEVNRWFKQAGWRVVDPGRLSLAEQLTLFSSASKVAGIHGAALTNCLWLPEGAEVLEIMPSRRRNGCYAGIALCAGQRHSTWVIPSDRLGNLHIPIAELGDKMGLSPG